MIDSIVPTQGRDHALSAFIDSRIHPTEGTESIFKHILQRSWKILVPCIIVSGVVGVLLAHKCASLVWTFESTMLYSKPAATASYTPPDGDSLAKVFKSPESLARLSDAFDKKYSPGAIDSALSINPPYGSCVLHVSITWRDPAQAAEILAKSIDLFREQVARQRNLSLQTAADGLRERLNQCNEQLKHKQSGAAGPLDTNDVAEHFAERTAARGRLTELEQQLMAAHIEQESAELRVRHVANPGYAQLSQMIAAATTEPQKKVKELERLTSESRMEYQRLVEAQRLASHDRHDAATLVQERQRLEDQLAVIHHLCTDPTAGLSIVQAATESLRSPTSNERKLALGYTIMIGFVLCAPVFGLQLLRLRQAPGVAWARSLGLNILEHQHAIDRDVYGSVDLGSDSHTTRLLARRLLQAVPASSGVLVFCGVGSPTAEKLLWYIARSISDSGKRVALLYIQPSKQTRTAALAASFSSRSRRGADHLSVGGSGQSSTTIEQASEPSEEDIRDRLLDSISATTLPGVDELRLGGDAHEFESNKITMINDVVPALRDRYEVVLISGCTAERASDAHRLAMLSNGVVFTVPSESAVPPSATTLVRELKQMEILILGVIV